MIMAILDYYILYHNQYMLLLFGLYSLDLVHAKLHPEVVKALLLLDLDRL